MKWVCLGLFGGVGLALFSVGVVWGARRYALWKGGIRTTGTVVSLSESQSSRTEGGRTINSTSYYPHVEFQLPTGKTHRFRGSTGSSSPDYEVGAKVELLYMPDNPDQAQITDFSQFWLGPAAIGIFGFVFMLFGAAGFFLVADSDRTFGPAFEARMTRASLFEMKKGIALPAEVKGVRKVPGEGGAPNYLVSVRGGAPGGERRDFESAPLSFDPGREIVGKEVTVYADPQDPARYYVHLDPLFSPESRQEAP